MRLPAPPDVTADWFARPAGVALMAAEERACAASLGHVFGTFSALFGIGSVASGLLDDLDFAARHVFAVGEGSGQFQAPVCARPSELPIASESLRLLVLQHVLETMRDPAEFLAECERVIVPGGTLAVLGLNPTGRALRWRSDPPPWVRRWWAAGELRQSLVRRAFELHVSKPVLSDSWWWERLARNREDHRDGRVLGWLGSGYLMVFNKPRNGARVIPLGRATRRSVAGVTSTVGSLTVQRLRPTRVARRSNVR